jgi:hypothetical protein
MAANKQDNGESGPAQDRDSGSEIPDPRDTDHPTGAEQADENAAEESPS